MWYGITKPQWDNQIRNLLTSNEAVICSGRNVSHQEKNTTKLDIFMDWYIREFTWLLVHWRFVSIISIHGFIIMSFTYQHSQSNAISLHFNTKKCIPDVFTNSLTPGKFEWKFRYVIFKQILVIDGWGISCEVALIWMSLGLHWWSVNIGSGNGLVPSGNKPLPEPMLTQISCRHLASLGPNELILFRSDP